MTQQLADARALVDRSVHDLDSARAHLQAIMDNLTAGVIVFDAHGRIETVNPGATRILRAPMAAYEGRPLSEVPGLADFAAAVERHFLAFFGDRDRHGLDHWQQPFELHASSAGAGQHATSLVARGAELPDGAQLLVFDDISEIVSAQRAQAWGEVARRLAHEIKNPLTPIQLSAERLEMKLSGKVPPAEQAILAKSVKTIVDQVDAMKRLVNEFRDYARLPAAVLAPVDLNAIPIAAIERVEVPRWHAPHRRHRSAPARPPRRRPAPGRRQPPQHQPGHPAPRALPRHHPHRRPD
jgi:nitrogen fixation/metabolism regulation signal transduction histidine kinase